MTISDRTLVPGTSTAWLQPHTGPNDEVPPSPAPPVAHEPPARGRVARLWRGPVDDPAWARPALLGLLLATGVLYVWGLASSGWANSFYSAAAQAGSQSWKAFFYGSSDAGNSITVDKTPASLWVMALSVRVFGLSSWSILVPQALMGVASVGILYGAVKRWFGAASGLIAGAVLALTPVAVLMFRFNNPDALLVLTMVAAAYAVVRAIENGGTRWLVLAGALLGVGFLSKMLQVLLVLPALGLAYLLAAPVTLWRRTWQLLAGFGAMLLAAGWWVAIVELVPASARPYIGGSQTNSIWELIWGYNGLGRLTGNEVGSVTGGFGGGNQGGMWGETGWLRLFDAEIGGQITWLMPAALMLLAAGVWLTWGRSRTDRQRAAYVIWGGWLVVTALVFSFMGGIFHAYYTVALAPAIGALVGMGSVQLWARRSDVTARAVLAGTLAVTAFWSSQLLSRSSSWNGWLGPVVLIGGVALAILIVALGSVPARVSAVVAGAGLAVALAGPAAYAVQTASTGHSGSIVTAGPTVAGSRGGPGGFGGPGGRGFGGGAPGGQGATPNGQQNRAGGFGGAGGLLQGSTASSELVALLQADASSYRWAAAAVGSNNAAGYQLASGLPVMAIGGFNGSDPSPTLEEFQQYVAAGEIHYFIGGGGFGSNGGSNASSEIAQWVSENFQAQTVGGTTVYDLTQ